MEYVITGGGSGIGQALAWRLADLGKSVLIVGRRAANIEQTASYSPNIQSLCADVSTTKGQSAIVEKLINQTQVTALIHNAGIIDPINAIKNISAQQWQQTMAINLNAPLFLTQALLPKLQQGKVLSIGSGAAYFPVKGWAAYCVSKAALSMLMRCWQLEYPQCAFASVMPGIIDTDMQGLIRNSKSMDEDKLQFFHTLQQQNKLITTQTVALFLSHLLLNTSKEQFSAEEWDIYDTTHHHEWLQPPHVVPPLE